VLIVIACDYLIIFTTNVGVKRLFNITKDICFYRRHYLKPATIRDLVITICINRFLLLKKLDNIKATKETEKIRLFKELKDQKIFKIKNLKSLINNKKNNIEDLNLNNDKITHRAVNENNKKNNKDKELKDFVFPALRRAELSQTRF
jgi:predicted membrane protein